MKTIAVSGTRTIDDYDFIVDVLLGRTSDMWPTPKIIKGECRGVDQLVDRFCREYGYPRQTFYADWDKYGNAAGPIRNKEMINAADELIAIWDGKSKGTRSAINYAKQKGIQVVMIKWNQ